MAGIYTEVNFILCELRTKFYYYLCRSTG